MSSDLTKIPAKSCEWPLDYSPFGWGGGEAKWICGGWRGGGGRGKMDLWGVEGGTDEMEDCRGGEGRGASLCPPP